MGNCGMLLFDLDGTLLRGDKTISQATRRVLRQCRERGVLLGIATSRGERNARAFIQQVDPDLWITSSGALAKFRGKVLYCADFSEAETRRAIETVRAVCGADCEMTIDTEQAHYWNYKVDPQKQDPSWSGSTYADFIRFDQRALKICVEIIDERRAKQLATRLKECDCVRFSGGHWYQFTKKTATKADAIQAFCALYGISAQQITAFGDDHADIGMMKLCETGVAMGNAVDEVKEQADLVIGRNDEDGIAAYLSERFHF